MLSENGDVIKIDTQPGHLTVSIPAKWRTDATMRAEGIKAFLKRMRRCSVDGRKRYANDKCGRKSF